LKVLLVGRYNDSDSLTGPEKFAKRIYESINSKHDVTFADYFFDGSKYGLKQKLFGKFTVRDNVFKFGIFKLFFFTLKLKPEVIHILNFERFACVVCFASLFFNTKIIYTAHGLISYEDKYFNNPSITLKLKNRVTEKIIFRFSIYVIFVSSFLESLVLKYNKTLKAKTFIIPPGVDREFYGREVASHQNDILEIVTFEYHPSRLRGITLLISALNELNINDFLTVLSENSNIIVLNHKSIVLKKNDYESYRHLLKNKDVIVCLSEYDTFSLFTAEAMCCGLIPIVSENTGVKDYISNGENGFIINNFNKNELKKILTQIGNDKIYRQKLSTNAMTVYNELNWDKISEKYLKLYNSSGL